MTEGRTRSWSREGAADALGERGRIAGGDQHGAVPAEHLGRPRRIGRDDTTPGGERFEGAQPEGLRRIRMDEAVARVLRPGSKLSASVPRVNVKIRFAFSPLAISASPVIRVGT